MDLIRICFFNALLLFLLAACNGPLEYQRELATVDSLRQQVQRYELMLDSIGQNQAREELEAVNQRFEKLQQASVPETDREFWVEEMGQLATLRKGLSRYVENRAQLEEAISYSAHQLETLHNSLRDEKLKKEEVEEYLRDEKQATESLKFQMAKNYHSARRALLTWELRRTHYDSLVELVN